jgi:hypothetical protein
MTNQKKIQTNKYLSKYSNGKTVSASQYITEIICEHLAIKNKKDLHYRFWLNKEWEKFYKSQIFSANKLLNKHSDKAIIAALKTPEGQKIYSLRAPHLLDIIVRQETIIQAQTHEQTVPIERNTESKGSTNSKKTNIFDRLKDIDNEH